MLKIYWHPLSTPSNKVVMCANALQLDFEKTLVDLQKGEQMGAEYLTLNPFGKIPAIDDDGFRLFESGAIVRYLARREKSVLYPSEYQSRALVDQWSDLSTHMVLMAMQKVFFHRVLAKMLGETPIESIALQGVAQLNRFLPVIDAHLKQSKFLVGSDMTIADISLLAVLDQLEVIEYDLDPLSNLSIWRSKLRGQEFYQATHKYYAEGIFPAKV